MRRRWHDLCPHRLAAILFLVLWFVTWLATIVTWERDAAGFSVGMGSLVRPLHLALPLLLGVLAGLYRGKPLRTLLGICALAGVTFGAVHFAILALVDALWLPSVEASPPFLELAAGAMVGALLYAGACTLLCMLGGGLGLAARR